MGIADANTAGGKPALLWALVMALLLGPMLGGGSAAVFNVRDYGATGNKADDARPAIQKAIAAAAAKGGTVLFPGANILRAPCTSAATSG